MAGAAVDAVDPSAALRPSVPRVAPTLSVTVLNYNYGAYLPGCLDSILAQTFRDFELIVIDDCSSDNSLDVIRPYLADPRVRLVAHKQNVGYSGSLIEGTEPCSTGEYVTVISADDLIHQPDAFERQIALLQANPQASFCFSAYQRFEHETGAVLQEKHSYDGDRIISGPDFLREYLTRQEIQVLHSGTMLRKSAYLKAGGYRRDLRMTLDFAMWPVLALQGDVAYCDQPLYAYRTHAAQMSSSFKKQHANFVEVMTSVEGACDAAVRMGVPIGTLREDAIRYALFAVALDDAFGGRPALAWYRSMSAVLLKPRLALTSRGLWITLARLLLGERGYDFARSAFRKPTPQSFGATHTITGDTLRHDLPRKSLFRDARVVLVVNSVEMGGVEEHVRQIATGLAARDAQVTVVVPEEPAIDPLARAALATGASVERLTLSQGMLRPSGLKRLGRLIRLLRQHRPDVLHLHLVGFDGGRWILIGAILARVPAIVCTIHVAPRERQGWKTRLGRALLTPFVDRYIAVSQASRDRLVAFLGMPPARLVAVPNAVELQRFVTPAEPSRSAVRAQWGIPPDAPVLGVLARLAPQKGLTYLVSALPAILAEHPDAYVLVVGEGYLRPDLEAQAQALGVQERLLLVGYHENVPDYLRASDLFVLPSLFEGMPLSILEAMGAGLPVIATAVDGTPEVVLDGETGLLVPPEDPDALARAVNRLLADRPLAARMGEAGRARADSFSEAALLDRVGEVYRQARGR